DGIRDATVTGVQTCALPISFGGPSGMVLLDMVAQLDPSTPVFYLDTGFLFPETYDLVAEATERYGIVPRAVRPELTAEEQAALRSEERRVGKEVAYRWRRAR